MFIRTLQATALSIALGAHALLLGEETNEVDADTALGLLLEGNQRFQSGKPRHPHETADWRQLLESGQHPFVATLSCSDSRVPPELIFDQGFGDLFVVRVAGNVVDTDVTASIEYATDHLEASLVLVLGHTGCGAVTAAHDHLTDEGEEPSEILSLLYRIEPAVIGLPVDATRDARIAEAIERNVSLAVRRLSRVPDLRRRIKAKQIRIVGALYDMHTGAVRVLTPSEEEETPQ